MMTTMKDEREAIEEDIIKTFAELRRKNEELKRMTEEYQIKSQVRFEKLKADFRAMGYNVDGL